MVFNTKLRLSRIVGIQICQFFTLLLSHLLIFPTLHVNAIPKRGNEPWSLILCKSGELGWYEPQTREWFEDWLIGTDESESVEGYFARVSNGIYTISGSNVYGWITLKHTKRDILAMVASSRTESADSEVPPKLGTEASFDFSEKIKELCVDAAIAEGFRPHRRKITVINSGTTAVFGKKTGVLISSQMMFSSVLTHEMVHSFYIGHSYSDRKVKVFPYASSGEYDDRYDLMSTANAYMHKSKFGMNGPGLNGAHLDFLGWLPMNRMLFFGRDGKMRQTVRLSSLSVPHQQTKGWLLVIIPYDRDNAQNYYTVELRTQKNFDRGIKQSAVLVHRVQKINEIYYSVLLSQSREFYELTELTEWVKFLEPLSVDRFQSIRVRVERMHKDEADVQIWSSFRPEECHLGETAIPLLPKKGGASTMMEERGIGTRVCVLDGNDNSKNNTTPASSSIQQQQENSHIQQQTAELEVEKQRKRNNFYGQRSTFGANSCQKDYVWRALDPYDYTCVTKQRHEMARREVGEQQAGRVDRDEPNGCMRPYLRRNAFAGDGVCVSSAEKFRIHRENTQSPRKLMNLAFFNGIDTVELDPK